MHLCGLAFTVTVQSPRSSLRISKYTHSFKRAMEPRSLLISSTVSGEKDRYLGVATVFHAIPLGSLYSPLTPGQAGVPSFLQPIVPG